MWCANTLLDAADPERPADTHLAAVGAMRAVSESLRITVVLIAFIPPASRLGKKAVSA